MEKLIKLSEDEKLEFGNFIKNTRSKIIPKPQKTLSIVLETYDINSINLNTISETINTLRELTYNEFLAYENDFNAIILQNISSKFDIANNILSKVSKDFFEHLPTNYDEFKSYFIKYFGCYAGEISPYIYELCLSNTQSRRSRAGKIFEAIIYFLYTHFNYSFNSQAKVGRRVFNNLGLGKVVDSILPNIESFKNFRNKTIVGSMKTTLRERWQEVVEEIGRSNLPNIYLLTCDTDISESKIRQMSEHNIVLVVFDSVKANLRDFRNVISFETYFTNEIPDILKYWDRAND
ncbi:type II restriction endonuclease [Campylobacter hyointestinalis]|uniref:EcoRII C terminal n=1 Tax=Campylobacter hyointestinalis subsp. hyointestinalis TaxID=91352 RepID=A0A9W5EX08_CAMHY|nr:type II restriction endonuclease [Campylobacter hyointestinalis]CUU74314.1 EcoRII C terminal [Campylobacter hyointestinalis subsp. hyointestinalis]CUU82107.1 EcoRII C terminal [Campylobacter hyointestinalis subsp. hyointestinalis]